MVTYYSFSTPGYALRFIIRLYLEKVVRLSLKQ